MSELIAVRNEAISHRDVCVLCNSESHLTLNLRWVETSGTLLNDEGLNSVSIIEVSSPDNNVTDCCVSNPSLLSVQNPASSYLSSSCLKARCITSIVWFGQTKAVNFLELDSWWEQSVFLLLITKSIDDGHSD